MVSQVAVDPPRHRLRRRGPGRGETCSLTAVAPALRSTRSWADARSATRMSKWTRAVSGASDMAVAWKESR